MMDTDLELLALNAGSYSIYYFNSTGYWSTGSGVSNVCSWVSTCDFACEVYNYDSRFMDYLGTWTITAKRGFDTLEEVTVTAWAGNAIDAAGVFPSIAYLDATTGYFVGLDKLDPDVSEDGGISYFYTEFTEGVDFSSFD
jgi:hypothetical protein